MIGFRKTQVRGKSRKVYTNEILLMDTATNEMQVQAFRDECVGIVTRLNVFGGGVDLTCQKAR